MLTFFLSATANSIEVRMGETPQERKKLRDEAVQGINCLNIDLSENMTVADYMAQCVNGLVSNDGCRVNIEKVCVNGKEVNFWSDFIGSLKKYGFETKPSNGLSEKNFSDSSQMYNKILLPNKEFTQLCTKIPGLPENLTQQNMDRAVRSLPSGNYVIESVPPTINPNEDLASATLHYKITVSVDAQGQKQVVTELQLRNSDATDRQLSSSGRSAPFKVVSTTDDLRGVSNTLFNENLVRCKKTQTFTGHEEKGGETDGHPSTFLSAEKQLLSA